MVKDQWWNLVIVVLTGCALLVTALVVRRELFLDDPERTPASRTVSDWRTYARTGHCFGPPRAPVTITVFSDFQCPYCRQVANRLKEVQKVHPGRIAVVYRHYPLKVHRDATAAARVSECAAEQKRFQAFHDALFADQDSIGRVAWTYYAKAASIPDLDAFEQCVAVERHTAVVARDVAAGDRLGVRATPTLLINGRMITGAPSREALESYIQNALRSDEPVLQDGSATPCAT